MTKTKKARFPRRFLMRALLPKKRGVESGDAGPDSVVLRGACGSGRPPPRTRRRRTTPTSSPAAAGNARRTEAAAELMTPTLGDAFVEEEAEERPDAKAKREAEEERKKKETERANRAAKADADADVSDLSRRLTVAEVASHYARKKAEKGKRQRKKTWNGGAPGLCRLAAPVLSVLSENSSVTVPEAGSDVNDIVNDIVHVGARRSVGSGAPYATECFLSRSYTEGFGAPVAFAAYPSADVLCRACGDVAWDPVRFPKREDSDLGTLGIPADASNLWCRDCLLADGAAGERGGVRESHARRVRDLPVDENVAARVALKRVLCRHALYAVWCERESLADERVRGDAETEGRVSSSKEIRWRMDPAGHGCPDSGRLCDREQTERDCSREVRVCGLPGDANPGDACLARVRAGDFEAHAASCAFQLVPCSRRDLGCTRAVRRKHAEAHFRLCEYRPFACPNRPRCAWRGLRRDVEAHLRKACAWKSCRAAWWTTTGTLRAFAGLRGGGWRGRARVHVRG